MSRRSAGATCRLGTAVLLAAWGCGRVATGPAPLPRLPFATDSIRSALIAPGVTYRYLHAPAGPWAIHLLEIDLGRCNAVRAVKGAPGAVGREKTSVLLGKLSPNLRVVGGVNADFFLFTPPGLPAGALIAQGRVIAGPSDQPVLGFDSAGIPAILPLHAAGSAAIGGERFPITGWNRAVPTGLALFDAGWGRAMDTASGVVEVTLGRPNPLRFLAADTGTGGVMIPDDGVVLLAGRAAPPALRAALLGLRAGDTLPVGLSLAPLQPVEAVGGRPLLLRDSLVGDRVDSEGQAGFATGRHPRTGAGIARSGKRLILAVVDGRQMPYSDGMTLRELADLLRALGAREALNLDGGGSTTMLVADSAAGGALRIANHPSDPAGERPVGDALAIVNRCR